VTVNPEILVWARNTAGLSAEEAARALGFKDTRDRFAVDRLRALEAGDEQPSHSVLLKMSKLYRRALVVFYLSEPPRIGDRGKDFRTLPGGRPPLYNPLLDALIRDIRGRQATVRALLEETNPKAVDFIGSASMSDSSEVLASRIKDRFNISLDEFRRQATVEDAFRYLRETIEAAGVYVLLLGNLGSYHTNLPAEVFRGFAIADPIAPFIFVNDQDARAAWAFTALHELTHLWLGATGVSGASMETRIEKYCSDVAGELLLPTGEIRALVDLRKAPFAQVIETLSTFASARNLSRAMVAYRFFRTDAISRRTWEQVTESLRQEWIASRKKQEQEETIGESGGPSYYVVKRHRLGDALLDLIRRSLGEGIITYTKAAQVLGVKPTRVAPLIYGTLLEGRR
jgi:Zn-dependent peptidase ImmA (M78 family)